jgi:hypothetical protein
MRKEIASKREGSRLALPSLTIGKLGSNGAEIEGLLSLGPLRNHLFACWIGLA